MQCCGFGMFIPDPGSVFSIPDPNCLHHESRSRIKEFKYFNPQKTKKWFLSSRKYDPGCSSRIPDVGSGCWLSIHPGSESATLGIWDDVSAPWPHRSWRSGCLPSTCRRWRGFPSTPSSLESSSATMARPRRCWSVLFFLVLVVNDTGSQKWQQYQIPYTFIWKCRLPSNSASKQNIKPPSLLFKHYSSFPGILHGVVDTGDANRVAIAQ